MNLKYVIDLIFIQIPLPLVIKKLIKEYYINV
jgi:hypothetical protein